jgi:hypothetical protein
MEPRVHRSPAGDFNIFFKSERALDTSHSTDLKPARISPVGKQGIDLMELTIHSAEGLLAKPPRVNIFRRERASSIDKSILFDAWFQEVILKLPVLFGQPLRMTERDQKARSTSGIKVGSVSRTKEDSNLESIESPVCRAIRHIWKCALDYFEFGF